MTNLKNKRAGMSLSVVLLVVLTLLLCVISLVTFNNSKNQQKEKFSDLTVLDSFYSDSEIFDFYIYTVAREVSETNPTSSEEFILKFQIAYLNYSVLDSVPREVMNGEMIRQIRNNTKYEVSIANRIIKFNLKDFDYSKIYSENKISAIKKISFYHNITFEIAL